MTTLAMDPLTLGHTAITLIAILSGLVLLPAMVKGQYPKGLTMIFLLFSVLTSATGFLFVNTTGKLTPAQGTGIVALIVLAVALYALYGRRLAGIWRATYVVTATITLYLNLFVLVIQLFLKVPALHALAPTGGGPVFGAAQGAVLLASVVTGWLATRNFRPAFA